MRSILAFFTLFALSTGLAAADTLPPPLAAAFAGFLDAKSFHATMQSTGQTVELDVVRPDKMHIVAAGGSMEMISISGNTYVKRGGSWMTMPAIGAMANLLTAPLSQLRTYTSAPKDDLRVSDLGNVIVNGVPTHGYAVGDVDHPKNANIYVGSDGMIYQMTSNASHGGSITITKYNAPITIAAPVHER
jgi:hypothetical protein